MRASALLFFTALEAAVLLLPQGTPAAPPMPPAPAIKFPDVIPVPKPNVLPVDPTASIVLNGEDLYVGESDVEPMVGVYPAGRLKVEVVAGPVRIKGKFVGGSGKAEWKHFSGKFVIIIEAAGKGQATFVAVPPGAMKRSEWIERSIEANNGAQPPPKPEPDVIPEPKPKPPVIDDEKKDPEPAPDLVSGPVWLVTVTGPERTIAAAKIVNATAFWKGLEASGHKFRHYSPSDPSAVASGYAKVHAALGDCLILTKLDGTLVKKVKLPATVADVERLLKETVKP